MKHDLPSYLGCFWVWRPRLLWELRPATWAGSLVRLLCLGSSGRLGLWSSGSTQFAFLVRQDVHLLDVSEGASRPWLRYQGTEGTIYPWHSLNPDSRRDKRYATFQLPSWAACSRQTMMVPHHCTVEGMGSNPKGHPLLFLVLVASVLLEVGCHRSSGSHKLCF